MDKIWYKSYDPGVPHTVNPDQYSSLVQIIEESLNRYSNKPAFINLGVPLTYAKLKSLSQAFAGYLQSECGLTKGDRIAIMMPNLLQYPVALFGALRAGLTIVNINPLCDYKELNHILKETSPKAVLIFSGFANKLEPALVGVNIKHIFYTNVGDLFPFPKNVVVNLVVKHIKKMIPKWHIPGAIPFYKTLDLKYSKIFNKVEMDSSDIAFLQFSEGRASDKKNCIMISHRNIIANMLQCTAFLESYFRQDSKSGLVNPFPFCKMISMMTSLGFTRLGTSIILITNPRDISAFVNDLKKYPFSFIFAINSMFVGLLENEDFRKLDFTHLKYTLSGGTTTAPAVAARWKELTGNTILEAYGLVETSPVVSMNPLSTRHFRGNVGLPVPSTDIKVCDISGKELPIGEIGELWVHGPQVMAGYYNDPEKTKAVLTEDGWLKTGDIVFINSDGFITLIDRKEDVITVGSRKVYAVPIEKIIADVKGVLEVAVIGVSDPKLGQHVKAYVVRSDQNVTEDLIIEKCKGSLKDYEIPTEIEFYSSLPKTSVGYLLRRPLREEAENETKGKN